MRPLHVFTETLEDPAADIALSRALLEAVADGYPADTLRLSRPPAMVAFGKLDRVQPGFLQAVQASRELQAQPVLRLAGGRAAAFHPGCLGLAWARPRAAGDLNTHGRFDELAELLISALSGLGVDAQRGEVPGEYCPGDSTVNARGRVKLVGVGQRAGGRAAHLGAVLVGAQEALTRRILTPVYAALGTAFDPASCGSVQAECGAGLEQVQAALRAAFAERYRQVEDRALPPGAVERAYQLAPEHRL